MFAGLPGEIRVCALLGTQRGKIPFIGPKRIAPEMEYVVSVAPIGGDVRRVAPTRISTLP